MTPSEWVPVRWYSGLLDDGVRKHANRQESDALSAWLHPESLALLQNTPFNCIVLDLAAGLTENDGRQQSLKPLIEAAKQRGLAVVGHVPGPADALASVVRSSGVDAILADKSGTADTGLSRTGLPAIVTVGPSQAGTAPASVVALNECEWPALRTGRGDTTSAGPTGNPWIDSNGWRSLLAREQGPGKTIWVTAEAKPNAGPIRPELYALAVADAGACGARWRVSLDRITQAGLLNGDSTAREAWATISKSVRFFEEHRAWSRAATFTKL